MPESLYPHITSPIRLGGIRLNNRILMGSMHTGLEESRGGYRKLAAFYAERILGGVELVVTGGIAPNFRGRLALTTSQLSSRWQLGRHRSLTAAVHDAGGHICLQILHAGRYAMHPFAVAPSAIRAPISRFTPRALSSKAVRATIDDFTRTAELAQAAGYDGVEVMGSEGYLINQFTCRATNRRTDEWGGDLDNRMRFPLAIVRGIRERVARDFAVIYRLSMLDLTAGGNSWQEVVQSARAIEAAGADAINTGIGWHEVRIPTIASVVPRAAFAWVTQRLKAEVGIPLITSNRINDPAVIEKLLAEGQADMVSMARPLLADPGFINKALAGDADSINTCIACNQGCLDRVFSGRRATCLVNPRACYETELPLATAALPKRITVIGLGPAGLAFAVNAARRGHRVTACDRAGIGGQFNLARLIPGKEEFSETLRYYAHALEQQGVEVKTGTELSAADIATLAADIVILATGVVPRVPDIPGIGHGSVMSYADYITGERVAGERVAIIGAGGIGFDVAARLVAESSELHDWYRLWGVDREYAHAGGVMPPAELKLEREITMLQRKTGKPGVSLGKSTGWIHRLHLRHAGVRMFSGVSYQRIDDAGLHVEHDGMAKLIEVDSIITCAGQESNRDLLAALQASGIETHVIGGADRAAELDAERAIRQGTELALRL